MKKQIKTILILIGIVTLCCVIMIGSSYLYLEFSLKSAETDRSDDSIPYAAPLPDSAGLLVTLPDYTGYLCYLNFRDENICISKIENTSETQKSYNGYTVSYKIEADYRFIANMIDRLGGIELYDSGETLRYTGMQILNKVEKDPENTDYKKEIIRKFFDMVALNGMTRADFVYIIENTNTDITIPDCYYWPPYIKKIAKNLQFMD